MLKRRLPRLRSAVAGASSGDLAKLKVDAAVAGLAGKTVTYGTDWFASASAEEASGAVAEAAAAVTAEELSLWLETYPTADVEYATKRAAGPYPGFRSMVMLW